MSLALTQRVKDLEEFRRKVESAKPGEIVLCPPGITPNMVQPQSVDRVAELENRVKDLENKYRMLNARVSRKNADVA